jgi:plastocyanin
MKTKFLPLFIVLVFLAGCASKAVPTVNPLPIINSSSTPGNVSTNIDITNFAFSPADITVSSGTTVTWTNRDSVAHTVVADDNSWGSTSLTAGAEYSFTFTQPGVYAYHCSVHPSMKGTITVNPQ